MGKTIFKIAAIIYVCFAIWAAYTSTPIEASIYNEITKESRSDYTVRVWTASWCDPCKRYKTVEVPRLIAMGFKVEVLDIDVDKTPKYIRVVPTVELIYEGKTLKRKIYWKAKSIEDFVTTL
jgi:thiol-disulfide isomerase/thioredoxin